MSTPYNPNDWLNQAQIAAQLNVPIDKVWEKVRALGPARIIRTITNPLDRREVLVHKDDVEIIRRSIFG